MGKSAKNSLRTSNYSIITSTTSFQQLFTRAQIEEERKRVISDSKVAMETNYWRHMSMYLGWVWVRVTLSAALWWWDRFSQHWELKTQLYTIHMKSQLIGCTFCSLRITATLHCSDAIDDSKSFIAEKEDDMSGGILRTMVPGNTLVSKRFVMYQNA